jgi:8-oxo-dGTP diphosphatase
MRRYGDPVRSDRTYVNRPGAYGVIRRGSRLLLTEQLQPGPELQLPGGGVDPGESPIRALHREVLEETGWTISIQRRLGAFQRYTFMPEYDLWARKVCAVYLCRPILRRHAPREPHHRPVWAPLDLAATRLGNAGDRAFVAALL